MGARIRTFRTIAGDEIHVEVFASHRAEPRVFVSARKLEGGAVEELELSRADVRAISSFLAEDPLFEVELEPDVDRPGEQVARIVAAARRRGAVVELGGPRGH